MDFFYFFVITGFFLWALRNIFFWVALWQTKEYRIDRLFVHFRETIQGRRIFLSVGNLLKWLLLLSYVITIFVEKLTPFYEIVLGVFFIVQGLFIFKEVLRRKIKRPVWTGKSIALILLSFFALLVLFFYPIVGFMLWLLILDRIIPGIVALFIFFLAFPTEIHRDFTIQKALRKMREYKNIIVIAVSGSYGKTSTKEYIAQVLARKFTVVKTPASNNTPIGVASTILRSINESTEIFVVEMGAYKRGEIAQLTKIVRPSISVTTAISDQHISLYGNLLNVIESEYELIDALPKNGLALFNGDNPLMQELIKKVNNTLAKKSLKKIIYQRFTQKPNKYISIGATNVLPSEEGVAFDAILKGKVFPCETKLFGNHVIENILPAIYLADKMGMSTKEIQQAVKKLTPPAQTLVKKQLQKNLIGIDDTFNASPESVISAMNYLSLYKKKKFFVLSPLIELGKEAKARHYQIGFTASTTCSVLFVLNNNFSKEILRGVKDGKGNCKVVFCRAEKATTEIAHTGKMGDVVLFEGKEAKLVLERLL